ncbi:hypothetical protein C5167_050122 [Papaver somniferum]|uniref:Transcriptional coactivator p15 (PC4) C-terminal domain-containing protein n=1 Tax=Papaver somniferum TaxID=3469 RepID=A0A4Y7KQH4_PAPSO|nr:hypothetical protein C5167_050122 [Papaver somniferum]
MEAEICSKIKARVIKILNSADMDGMTEYKLSEKRRVTVQDFKGKTMVSIRGYYQKDGKHFPSSKGLLKKIK